MVCQKSGFLYILGGNSTGVEMTRRIGAFMGSPWCLRGQAASTLCLSLVHLTFEKGCWLQRVEGIGKGLYDSEELPEPM